MTEKLLKTGHSFSFSNEDYTLDVFYSEPSPSSNWTSPFQAWFNGKLFGFKTFKGLNNKVNSLINNYNLN